MAASAVSMNRAGSSMVYVEEIDNESKEQTQQRIKQFKEAQLSRTSSYCSVSFHIL